MSFRTRMSLNGCNAAMAMGGWPPGGGTPVGYNHALCRGEGEPR